ncbi:MAG: cation transporter [Neisseria sp.]|uniref:heavy-metal-associated domain-containing protein n=1 Tax=Neisseria sp. TaxID=192066 RepID=UPI0026DBB252|nr:cation transporter [Neisseria sp.]MDO4641646.1 cation transporter [Neisseria sp.]
METVNIHIEGMTCGGCVKSVAQVLTQLEGVDKVEVSLENANATVSFNAAKIGISALIEAIEDAGFDASA